ncbi:MAG TPA: aldehyde ferredoxin oxidoreductase C-terminal domain-containing protein, partial [Clostridia bacterium]|nr:aldehyde ferredoxin oxidoreductase C-terminal domain-containing protein [Clostridia bacterium]
KLVRAIFKLIPYFGGAVGLAHKFLGILAFNLPSMVPYPVAINYVTGMKLTLGEYLRIGERGYNLERLVNIRQGLTSDDDTLPKRLLEEPQISNKSVVRLDKMKNSYYKIRGWKDGVPTERVRRKLKI